MIPFRRAVLLPVMCYTSFESATWTQLSNVGNILGARATHATAVLSDGETAVMFGGSDGDGSVIMLGDANKMVISGTTSTWVQLSHAGDTPSARRNHAMTTLPDGRIIMYAASSQSSARSEEIYTLDFSGSTATCLLQCWRRSTWA